MITQHMFMLCAQLRTGYKGSKFKTHPCHPRSQQSIRETAEQRGACHTVSEGGGGEMKGLTYRLGQSSWRQVLRGQGEVFQTVMARDAVRDGEAGE